MAHKTHKWDKQYNIVFAFLLTAGLGLCIAGIWIPPLLVPGGVFLTGAFGMYASAYTRMYPWRMDEEEGARAEPMPLHEESHERQPDVTINIDDHTKIFAPAYSLSLQQHELPTQHSSPARLTLV